uniref:DNA 3'-5' helicase n=1 Tax=Aceria tosichella TaxID=561515 RepID=A0A6G1SJS3_9ACAR
MTNNQVVIRKAVSELPPRFRPVFPYINFNQVQSIVYDTMLGTNKPVVVSAPTGSGKTGVFELAIIKVIIDAEHRRITDVSAPKVVYLAPTKALCTERKLDWERKFKQYNIQCIELTSDSSLAINFKELNKTCILLATPEKWDSITRTWVGQRQFIQSLRLLLVDEVHLVNDGFRGATLEAVISRMKTIRSLTWPSEPDNLRFVAVSATIWNVQDIADWFSSPSSIAEVHKVDPNQRPVKLRTIVLGYTANTNVNEFSFDNLLNHKLADLIKEHSNGKPTLIFCATRKSSMQAANTLVKEGKFDLSFASEKRKLYLSVSEQVKDKNLQETTRFGIAFHHAGLSLSDRRIIETGFLDGSIMVLSCTSTLAMGVNLPAHLVIIKNTSYYDEGKFKPYSESSLIQMIGRAGRPQFDTEATAVIMTKSFCRDEIEKMLTGNLVVDSQLHKYLTEHLVSEIVLGTITSDAVARKWIDSTYLHVRLKKNPENYGLKKNCPAVLKEAAVANWCSKSIELLAKHKLIERTPENKLVATDTGRAMARHYLSFQTMVCLTNLSYQETELELLTKICSCNEVVGDIQIRNEDKPSLVVLVNPKKQEDSLKYPMNEKVQTKEKKALVLIQATFGNLTISENNLYQESIRIVRNASRIANCLRDIAHLDENISYNTLTTILTLAQSFAAKLWSDSIYVSKQLENIGPILSHSLAQNGLKTFESLRRANPRNIEIFCHRCPPFGSNVQQTCFGLPIYDMQIHFRCIPNQTDRVQLMVEIVLVNGQDLRSNRSLPPEHKFSLIVGSKNDDRVLLRRRVSDYGLLIRPDMTICLGADFDRISMPEEGTEIEARLISEGYVGLDVKKVATYTQPEDDSLPFL